MADFEEAGDDDVFRKVRKDFDAKGVAQSDQDIRRTMDELMEQAIAQIKAGIMTAPDDVAHRVSSWTQTDGQPPRLLACPPACAPARPSTPAGAALPSPIVAETIAREGFSPSPSTSSTASGTLAATVAAIAAIRRAARRRWCAFRSALSRWRAACSISAPKA